MTQTTTPPNVADVEEAMRDVVDPELGINVVDLGLVYGITVDAQSHAVLDMTLTSAACPLTDVIEDQTAQALEGLVATHRINWVWMPPWGPTRSPRTAASSCAPSASTSEPAPPAPVTTRLIEVDPSGSTDGWRASPSATALRRRRGDHSRRRRRVRPRRRRIHCRRNAVHTRTARRHPRPARRVCRGASPSRVLSRPPRSGTRHVQSRTAAGGWSQQRFARRRGKQADELVDAVVGHARRVLLADDESRGPVRTAYPVGWSSAGTARSCGRCSTRARCAPSRGYRCVELYDLPDPKRDVLETRCGAAGRSASSSPTLTTTPPTIERAIRPRMIERAIRLGRIALSIGTGRIALSIGWRGQLTVPTPKVLHWLMSPVW